MVAPWFSKLPRWSRIPYSVPTYSNRTFLQSSMHKDYCFQKPKLICIQCCSVLRMVATIYYSRIVCILCILGSTLNRDSVFYGPRGIPGWKWKMKNEKAYVWFNATQSISIIFIYFFKVFECTYHEFLWTEDRI